MNLTNKTLIVLSPAFVADESEEETSWLQAQQIFIHALNRNYPQLEVIIFAFHLPATRNVYQWYNNTIIPFNGALKGKYRTVSVMLNMFRKLIGLGNKKEILGIISFWCGECAFVGSWFSKFFGYKHLCWISGQDARTTNKLIKYIRPKSEELVAMSDFLVSEFYKNHHIRPQYLIPDAIDTTLFSKEPSVRTVDVLGAGGLHALKRYNLFVEVVAEIAQHIHPLNAMLCGSGELEKEIRKQVSEAELENVLCCTGTQTHKQVLNYMQKTKVFLHTSSYEGFGNVCIEALYAGAHVISFTRAMNQDMPHWHIVSTKEEMINKALELLQNPQTEYTSVFPFDMNDSAKRFIELLTKESL